MSQRKLVSLEKRLEAIRRLDRGEAARDIAIKLGVSKLKLISWQQNRIKIEEWCKKIGASLQRKTLQGWRRKLPTTGEALALWYAEQRRKGIMVTTSRLHEKALYFQRELQDLTTGSGWLERRKEQRALLEAGNTSHLVDPSQDTDSNASFFGGQFPLKLPRKQEPHSSKDEYYTGASDAGPAFDPPVQHEDDSHSTFVDYVFQATAQKELQITKTPIKLESTDRSSNSRSENEPKPGTSSQNCPIKIVCAPDLRAVKSPQALGTAKDAIQITQVAPPPQPPPPPPPRLVPATRLLSKSVSITYKPKEPPSSSSTSTNSSTSVNSNTSVNSIIGGSTISRIPVVYFGDEPEQESTANIEKVLMQLRAEKLMLEMDKLKAEREKMGVEVRNITLRRKILTLRKELFQSGPLEDNTVPANGWEEDNSPRPRALPRISVVKPDKLSISHVESLKMKSVSITPVEIRGKELSAPVIAVDVNARCDPEIIPTEVTSQSTKGSSQISEVPVHCPDVPEVSTHCSEVPALCPEVSLHSPEAPVKGPEESSHSSDDPSLSTVEISKQTESPAIESSVDGANKKDAETNQKSGAKVVKKTAKKRRASERGGSASNSSFLQPLVGSDDEIRVKVESEDPEKLEKVGIFYESSAEGLDIDKRLHPSSFNEDCSTVENNASGETSGGSTLLETRLLGSSDRRWNPGENSGEGCLPGYQELSLKRLEFESSSVPDENEDIVAKRKRIEDEFGLHMDMN